MLSVLLLCYSKLIDLPKWSCVCGYGQNFGHSCHDVTALQAEAVGVLPSPPVHKRIAALRAMSWVLVHYIWSNDHCSVLIEWLVGCSSVDTRDFQYTTIYSMTCTNATRSISPSSLHMDRILDQKTAVPGDRLRMTYFAAYACWQLPSTSARHYRFSLGWFSSSRPIKMHNLIGEHEDIHWELSSSSISLEARIFQILSCLFIGPSSPFSAMREGLWGMNHPWPWPGPWWYDSCHLLWWSIIVYGYKNARCHWIAQWYPLRVSH